MVAILPPPTCSYPYTVLAQIGRASRWPYSGRRLTEKKNLFYLWVIFHLDPLWCFFCWQTGCSWRWEPSTYHSVGEPVTFFSHHQEQGWLTAISTCSLSLGVRWHVLVQALHGSLHISACLTLPDSQWPAIQECETGENTASALCDK